MKIKILGGGNAIRLKVHTDKHWRRHIPVTCTNLPAYFGEEVEVRHGR